jgi:hypothetical protein
MGHWIEIKPNGLGRKSKDHPWIFARYTESPQERGDGSWYFAFLFRDEQRQNYGILEHCGKDVPYSFEDCRILATKVIVNRAYRNKLLSDDPRISKMWEKK